jgi:hypothetical protein
MQSEESVRHSRKKITRSQEKTMTIQKKSLINSLNTTKKALVATTPEKGSATAGAVKPGKIRAAAATLKPARINPARINPARINPARINPARINPAKLV